jgi:hypothetical protein
VLKNGVETVVDVDVVAPQGTVYQGERWVLRMICGAKVRFARCVFVFLP